MGVGVRAKHTWWWEAERPGGRWGCASDAGAALVGGATLAALSWSYWWMLLRPELDRWMLEAGWTTKRVLFNNAFCYRFVVSVECQVDDGQHNLGDDNGAAGVRVRAPARDRPHLRGLTESQRSAARAPREGREGG